MIFKKVISAQVREKRRKRLIRNIYIFIIIFLFSFSIFTYLTWSSVLHINEIEIKGTKVADKELVTATLKQYLDKNILFILSRSTFFMISEKKVESLLKNNYPIFEEITVDISDIHKLVVNVKERKPHSLWCGEIYSKSPDSCFFLDSSGYIFSKSPVFTGDVYFTYFGGLIGEPIGKNLLTTELMFEIENIIARFSDIGFEVTDFEIIDNGDANMYLKNDGKIIVNISSLSKAFVMVSASVKQNAINATTSIEYLDTRFGNKLIIKRN